MIMAERRLPTNVMRAYQMLTLVRENLDEVKRKQRTNEKSILPHTIQSYSQGFYTAREALVDAVYDEMTDADRRCVRNALVAAGLPRLTLESVRFYYDLYPIMRSGRRHWWLHVFYGGQEGAMGRYHGHIIVMVAPDGEVVSIKLHRRPNVPVDCSDARL